MEKKIELSKKYNKKDSEFKKRRNKIVADSINVFNKLSKEVQHIVDDRIKSIEAKKIQIEKVVKSIENEKTKKDIKNIENEIKSISEWQTTVEEVLNGIYTGPSPLFVYEEIKQFILNLSKYKKFKKVSSEYLDTLPNNLVKTFQDDLYYFERDTTNEVIESWVNLERFLDKDTNFIKDNENILFQDLLNYYDIYTIELLYKNKFINENDNDKLVYVLENLFLDLEKIHFMSHDGGKDNKISKKKVLIEISETKNIKKYEILINDNIRFPVEDVRRDSVGMYKMFYKLVEKQGYKDFIEKYVGFVKNINNNSYLSKRLKEAGLSNKILKEKDGNAIIENNFILKIK